MHVQDKYIDFLMHTQNYNKHCSIFLVKLNFKTEREKFQIDTVIKMAAEINITRQARG